MGLRTGYIIGSTVLVKTDADEQIVVSTDLGKLGIASRALAVNCINCGMSFSC